MKQIQTTVVVVLLTFHKLLFGSQKLVYLRNF